MLASSQPIHFVVALILFAVFFIVAYPFNIWMRARVAGTLVDFRRVLAMWIRRGNAALIVDCWITLEKAGIDHGINLDYLEAHLLAGGAPDDLVLGLIAAHKAKLGLTADDLAKIDLSDPGTGAALKHVRDLVHAK